MHNLPEVENYVLFDELSEDVAPRRQPLSSEELFVRGKGRLMLKMKFQYFGYLM